MVAVCSFVDIPYTCRDTKYSCHLLYSPDGIRCKALKSWTEWIATAQNCCWLPTRRAPSDSPTSQPSMIPHNLDYLVKLLLALRGQNKLRVKIFHNVALLSCFLEINGKSLENDARCKYFVRTLPLKVTLYSKELLYFSTLTLFWPLSMRTSFTRLCGTVQYRALLLLTLCREYPEIYLTLP